ncbi:hypothetical protein EDB83DRAFT_2513615 [Lactarius deliciosus]|nr:hypothetical protein EDB83DRAFT_2513615 [Lactarius deliciosus]
MSLERKDTFVLVILGKWRLTEWSERIICGIPSSPDNNLGNNEKCELDKELEQSLDDTQLVLSLQIADDVDLEMDVDLQKRVEALDGGGMDDDKDKSDFFC